MIIKVLAENTSVSEKFGSEHGLSLYIETQNRKLLFDTGASALFAENAVKMNVDLSAVDLAVISHGHSDHGGGLRKFLGINSKAKIYIHHKAFEDYYGNRPNGEKVPIGLDKALLPNKQFVFTGNRFVIEEGLTLFSNVKGDRLRPSGNKDLFHKTGESYAMDDFAHEQNLVLEEDGKTLLIAGCAHNGIVNILEKFHAEKGRFPDMVFGGFHLYDRATKQSESRAVVDEIAAYLISTKAKFYTCHCTGLESYSRLKAIMTDHIDYISAGSELSV